jgi:hypothetical protein
MGDDVERLTTPLAENLSRSVGRPIVYNEHLIGVPLRKLAQNLSYVALLVKDRNHDQTVRQS